MYCVYHMCTTYKVRRKVGHEEGEKFFMGNCPKQLGRARTLKVKEKIACIAIPTNGGGGWRLPGDSL